MWAIAYIGLCSDQAYVPSADRVSLAIQLQQAAEKAASAMTRFATVLQVMSPVMSSASLNFPDQAESPKKGAAARIVIPER